MILGVDYASVDSNAPPAWSAARAGMRSGQPLGFAIVRGAYSTIVDGHRVRDWDGIRAAGLVRGAYLFLVYPQPGGPRVPMADLQAKVFSQAVQLDPSDFPPILDVEFPGGNKMPVADALAWTRLAWDALHKNYGVPPMIYTSARVWHEDLKNVDAPWFADSPLWLAKPWPFPVRTAARLAPDGLIAPTVTNHGMLRPWGDPGNWWIQQYQGDALGFPGFTNTVDINRFNVMKASDNAAATANGTRVAWVQRRLGIAQTGVYGIDTIAAVKEFQHRSGLFHDGVIGPRTFARICWAGGAERVT